MNFFSFLDKHGKTVLVLLGSILAYFALKKASNIPPELETQAEQKSHETRLNTPKPAPASASEKDKQRAAVALKEHRSAVIAEKLHSLLVPLHWSGPGRDFSNLEKLAFDIALYRIPFTLIERDYKAVNPDATTWFKSSGDLRTDLRKEFNEKPALYTNFIKTATMPYDQAAKLFNSRKKK
jgi:hypothetical protein